jgi:predicted amidohydrolase YtcJ
VACAVQVVACATPRAELPVAAPCTTTQLLVTGAILTMDEPTPRAQAMLIEDGRIRALGPSALELVDDEPVGARCTKRLALDERAVALPGIIDGHVHVRELGADALKADLVGSESVEDMVERLHARFPEPRPGTWLVGQGWDEGAFGSRGYPDRAALDRAFPDNPVALESLHGFAGFYNARALETAGVDASTPDPEGGTILRRDDGSPTGVMLTLAQDLVRAHLPPLSDAQRESAIEAGLRIMAAEGVTSVHEAGMSGEDVRAFRSLADQARLPIRVYGMLDGNDDALMSEWFERGPWAHEGGRLTIRAIKVFYDGSLGSRTAVLAAPYHDAPETARPTERISPAAMRSLATRAAATGFQLAVHAIGDEANRRTLEVFRTAVDADAPDEARDHRWRIEHAQVVLPEFFDDAASLGVAVSMQPSHAVGDSAWAEQRLGPERIQRAYAWRAMLDAGVPLVLNSDLPGEPWTPMQTLFFAVNRTHLDGTPAGDWSPESALGVGEVLRAMTTTAAWAEFADSDRGRLAPGLAADFTVLDRDPFDTPAGELASIRVRSTWVDGVRVPTARP